ncbi:MAG: hypothetical protein IPJ47_15085 [Anaerolineales bacterium]|nr:hypothetical protein [Anaerolineales bacterium]
MASSKPPAARQDDVVGDGVTVTEERKQKVTYFSESYALWAGHPRPVLMKTAFMETQQNLAALTDATSSLHSSAQRTKRKPLGIVGEDRVKSFDTFRCLCIGVDQQGCGRCHH